MLHTSYKNKEHKSEYFKASKCSDDYCEVSNASKVIILDRFYNGNRIEFPFAP